MNINDSEILAGLLESVGYTAAATYTEADLVLVNTCTIRQKAEDKALGFAYRLRKLKEKNPNLIVGLCGCVAQQQKEKLLKQLPFVDLVMGPQGIDEFLNLLKEIEVKNEPIGFFTETCEHRQNTPAKRPHKPRAYINIMYGCNNYCAYCIVPYVRGREVYRPIDDIIAEIESLDHSIHKDIVLLGQNVNSWKQGDKDLADLLAEVHKIAGVEWLSFMTSHPKDMSDKIIAAVASLPKVNNYIHLPIQSGSSKILAAMHRGYDRDYYLRLVEKIRTKIPNVTLTTDLIVGFPGETEADFNESIDLIKQVQFDSVITGAYSIRPGTKAATMPGQLEPDLIKSRLQTVMKVVDSTALSNNEKLVNQTLPVLVEGKDKQGRLAARTRGNKIVYFESQKNILPGKIVSVRIKRAQSWILEGEMN